MLGQEPRDEIGLGIGLLCCADVRGSWVLLVLHVRSSSPERGNEAAGLVYRYRLIDVSVKHPDRNVLIFAARAAKGSAAVTNGFALRSASLSRSE